MLTNYNEIFAAIEKLPKKTISVAMADDHSVLEAIKSLKEKDIANAYLVGDSEKIRLISEEIGFAVEDKYIISADTPEDAATKSVELIRLGKADVLMKGHILTPILMKAVLDKEKGLRKGSNMSHVAVAEVENYPRLIFITDGGININLSLETKVAILKNAVDLANKVGLETPNIAALCPIEKVNPKIQETVDADELRKMAADGEFGNVVLEGPIAMDVALTVRAAKRKGIDSKIAGKTDIFLVPSLTTGNALIKILMVISRAKVGGVVLGAKVPIILLSRSDNPEEKMYSIGLSIIACD